MKKKVCGIYEIKNTKNGKFYIGSSKSIYTRWVQHKRELKKGTHHNAYLQRSYNVHGEGSYDYSIIEECSEDNLFEVEQGHLDKHYGKKECYNLNEYASRPPILCGINSPNYGQIGPRGENHACACPIIVILENGKEIKFPCVQGPGGAAEKLGLSVGVVKSALRLGFFGKYQVVPSVAGRALICRARDYSLDFLEDLKKKRSAAFQRHVIVTLRSGKELEFSSVRNLAKEVNCSTTTVKDALKQGFFSNHPRLKEDFRNAIICRQNYHTPEFIKETKKKMSEAGIGEKYTHPSYCKLTILLEGGKEMDFVSLQDMSRELGVGQPTISKALKQGFFGNHSNLKEQLHNAIICRQNDYSPGLVKEIKKKMSEARIRKAYVRPGRPVIIIPQGGKEMEFASFQDISREFGVHQTTIRTSLKRGHFTDFLRLKEQLHNAIICRKDEYSPELAKEIKERMAEELRAAKNKRSHLARPVIIFFQDGKKTKLLSVDDVAKEFGISRACTAGALKRGYFSNNHQLKENFRNAIICYESDYSPELVKETKERVNKLNDKIIIKLRNGKEMRFSSIPGAEKQLGIRSSTIRRTLKRGGWFSNHPRLKEALRGARIAYLN